jgi:hypothetical protein
VVWEEGGNAFMGNGSWDETRVGVRLEEKILEDVCAWSVRALGDVSWAYRKAGCQGVKKLCELGVVGVINVAGVGEKKGAVVERETRRASCSVVLLESLLKALQGRVWGGKNIVVEAIGDLVASWSGDGMCAEARKVLDVYKAQDDDLFAGDGYFKGEKGEEEADEVEGVAGVAGMEIDSGDGKLEVDEGEREEEEEEEEAATRVVEENRTAKISLLGVCRLVYQQSLTKSTATFALPYKIAALAALAKIGGGQGAFLNEGVGALIELEAKEGEKLPPVVLARRIDVLAALVHEGMEGGACERLEGLIKHEAWTVRESVLKYLGKVAELGGLDRKVLGVMDKAFMHGAVDRKFGKIRVAAYGILRKLARRAQGGKAREEGVVELVVVYKESWEGVVRKRGLQDPESDVTQLSSELVVLLGQW